jgi:hypothetical protein
MVQHLTNYFILIKSNPHMPFLVERWAIYLLGHANLWSVSISVITFWDCVIKSHLKFSFAGLLLVIDLLHSWLSLLSCLHSRKSVMGLRNSGSTPNTLNLQLGGSGRGWRGSGAHRTERKSADVLACRTIEATLQENEDEGLLVAK